MGSAFSVYVTLIFVLVSSTLLFPMNKYVPLDRRLVSVFGAILCVLIMFIFDEGKGINIGSEVDFPVIIVLTSIMAINFILLKQSYVRDFLYNLKDLIAEDLNKGYYWLCTFSFIISPFILNDGLCLMIVHPLLDAFVNSSIYSESSALQLKSKHILTPTFAPTDPFYYLIGVVCSANIGSVLTYSGNPQNILIAAHLSKYMNCGIFFLLMFLPAFISWIITIYFINFYRLKASREFFEKYYKSHEKIGMKKLYREVNKYDLEIKNIIHNDAIILSEDFNDQDLEFGKQEKNKKKKEKKEINLIEINKDLRDCEMSEYDLSMKCRNSVSSLDKIKSLENGTHGTTIEASSSISSTLRSKKHLDMRSKILKQWDPLFCPPLVTSFFLLLILLLFFSSFPLGGLFATISVIMIVFTIFTNYYELNVFDNVQNILLRKKYLTVSDRLNKINQTIEDLFLNLDYNLLFIFVGIFIVSGSFIMTNIPKKIYEMLSLKNAFHQTSSLLILSAYVILASQLVGNVPVVFMVQDEIKNIPEENKEIFGWLILSFVSTVAGNFTLVGSAANIIVVEKAIR